MNNNIITQDFELILKSTDLYPVSFEKAYQWVGFARKDHAVRLLESNYTENQDYIVFPLKGENPLGGRPQKEYYLTIDCFKSYCMLAQTQKGKEVRNYFLECEKKLNKIKNTAPAIDFNNVDIVIKLLKTTIKAYEDEKAERKQIELKHKELERVHDTLSSSDSLFTIEQLSKSIGIGSKTMWKFLKEHYLTKKTGLPYQHDIDNGIFKIVVKEYKKDKDNPKKPELYSQIHVTSKGLFELTRVYIKIHPEHKLPNKQLQIKEA